MSPQRGRVWSRLQLCTLAEMVSLRLSRGYGVAVALVLGCLLGKSGALKWSMSPCGAIGREGPTLAECEGYYGGDAGRVPLVDVERGIQMIEVGIGILL